MSVRAYKIKKIINKKSPTFNCWHEPEVIDYAMSDNYNDGGYLTFFREDVEDGILECKSENIKRILKKILKDMGKEDDVEYIKCG